MNSFAVSSWILGILVWTTCLEGSGASWLRGKSSLMDKLGSFVDGSPVMEYRGDCTVSQQTSCWCGEGPDRRQTIVDIKQCPYSTAWGSQCEPCTPPEELCQSLQHCARCSLYNPNAICADCPPDRHGLRCNKIRPCKTPNITEHMTVHPYFTQKGVYKLEFRCTGGRVRDGPKVIRCLSNSKQWNKTPPKCVQPMRCSSLPTAPIPFTRVKEEGGRGERVVYECDVGYVASGKVLETVLHCHNGVWVQVGDSVQCEPSPKCTALPDNNGTNFDLGARLKADTLVKSVYHVGETVHYECEDSFRPVSGKNSFAFVCNGEQWDGLPPDCELRGCRNLSVDHGEVTYSTQSDTKDGEYFPLNTVAKVACHKSFMLNGSQDLTCSRTGHWLPALPQCIPKACDEEERGKMCSITPASPFVVPDTNRTEIYPGETITFSCQENSYRKLNVGQKERICLHNGTLTGSEIQCNHVPMCRIIVPDGDAHVRYCRGKNCIKEGEKKDKTYELPPGVVSLFGHVEFSCDSKFYCLNASHSVQCMPSPTGFMVKAPRCKPVCGERRFPKEPLIMGGQASRIEEWPWQSALMEVRRHEVEFSCGATLIDDKWAVTAAHCVTFENSTEIRDTQNMRLTYGLSSSQEAVNHAADRHRQNKAKYKVHKMIIHKDYTGGRNLDHDIALLELETPVHINHHVGVACLPSPNQHLVGGEQGVVTGWGRTESELLAPELRELPLTVINSSQCRAHFRLQGYNGVVVTDGMFCAISNSSKEDATDGDSGGPFVVQDKDHHWVLEGIVSWGAPDKPPSEEKDSPDVNVNRRAHVKLSSGASLLPTCRNSACVGGYTRVSQYITWIRQQTNGRVGSSRCG